MSRYERPPELQHPGAQSFSDASDRWEAFLETQVERLEQECLQQFHKSASCGRIAYSDRALSQRLRRVQDMT